MVDDHPHRSLTLGGADRHLVDAVDAAHRRFDLGGVTANHQLHLVAAGRTPSRCASLPGAPSATIRPSLMISTRSHVASTSDRMWLERITVWSAPELLDEVARLARLARVEARGRLVEDQRLGFVDDRLREADPLPQPARQPADHLVAAFVEAARLDRVVDARASPRRRHAAQLAHQLEEAGDAHLVVERRGLRQVADAAAHLERLREDVEACRRSRSPRLRRCSR